MHYRSVGSSVALSLIVASAGIADTITVCPDGCHYASIQEAISAAQIGDTISIEPGSYFEHDINLEDKGLVITGTLDEHGDLATTVDAEGIDTVFRSQSGPEGTTIRNLILTGGNGYQANSSDDRFGGAMYIYGGHMLIENCLFTDNYARTWCGGIYAFQTNLAIHDSTFVGNEARHYSVIKNYNGSTTISNCTIASNFNESSGSLIDLGGSGVHEVIGCRFFCNYPEFQPEEGIGTDGNCFGLDCPDSDLDGDYVPDDCTNAVSVCPDGCAYVSVNDAIEAAPADGYHIIQLAAESYCEGAVIDLDGKPVSLRGFASETGKPLTTLSGSGLNRVVICNSDESQRTELKDLVIHSGVDHDGNGGAGMLVRNSGPTISNCVFFANHATGNGGGLLLDGYSWMDPDGASGINDCLFIENSATSGGGLYITGEGGSLGASLEDCLLIGNIANSFGGGLAFSSDCSLNRVSIIDNTAPMGAGIAGWTLENPWTIIWARDSTVQGNSGSGITLAGGARVYLDGTIVCGNDGAQLEGEEPLGDSYCVSISCDECESEDSDGDGVVDHLDACPGGDDTIDIDEDGTPDFCDDHVDSNADCDGDGIPDPDDICPGGDDTVDRDLDGTPDFCDECPDNPKKTEEDACGCEGQPGQGDIDTDMDGTPDCLDNCPDDPNKTEPGFCGCNVVDTNVNGDVDCDGDYDEDDIRLGMANFGIQEASSCVGDVDGDGEVGPLDLALILGAWGVCP